MKTFFMSVKYKFTIPEKKSRRNKQMKRIMIILMKTTLNFLRVKYIDSRQQQKINAHFHSRVCSWQHDYATLKIWKKPPRLMRKNSKYFWFCFFSLMWTHVYLDEVDVYADVGENICMYIRVKKSFLAKFEYFRIEVSGNYKLLCVNIVAWKIFLRNSTYCYIQIAVSNKWNYSWING